MSHVLTGNMMKPLFKERKIAGREAHKMVRCVLDEVDENRTDIVRCHTSSGTALAEILEKHSA